MPNQPTRTSLVCDGSTTYGQATPPAGWTAVGGAGLEYEGRIHGWTVPGSGQIQVSFDSVVEIFIDSNGNLTFASRAGGNLAVSLTSLGTDVFFRAQLDNSNADSTKWFACLEVWKVDGTGYTFTSQLNGVGGLVITSTFDFTPFAIVIGAWHLAVGNFFKGDIAFMRVKEGLSPRYTRPQESFPPSNYLYEYEFDASDGTDTMGNANLTMTGATWATSPVLTAAAATACPNRTVRMGETIKVLNTIPFVDGLTAAHSWSVTSGPGTLTNTTSPTVTVTPTGTGTIVISDTVTFTGTGVTLFTNTLSNVNITVIAANTARLIMPLGDSITLGLGDGGGSGTYNGYRKALDAALTAASYSATFVGSQTSGSGFTNTAHEGHQGWYAGGPPSQTTVSLRDNIEGFFNTSVPEHIICMAGTNDDLNMGLDASGVSVEGLYEQIFRLYPSARVYACTIPDQVAGSLTNAGTIAEVAKTNTHIKSYCAKLAQKGFKIFLIDVNPNVSDTNISSVDGVHPTATGYAQIAADIFSDSAGQSYSISGPATGTIGVASAPFTLTLAGGATFDGIENVKLSYGSNMNIVVTNPGGSQVVLGSSATVTPAAGQTGFSWTFAPTTGSAKTIAYTNNTAWTDPSNSIYTPAVGIPAQLISAGNEGSGIYGGNIVRQEALTSKAFPKKDYKKTTKKTTRRK